MRAVSIPAPNHDESRPRFSPDGRRLIFTSKAGDVPQVWITGFDANAGTLTNTPRALTALSTGASDAIWSPDGKNVVFVSSVYPDAKSDTANKERDETLKKSKVKAQLFTHLFYRHWNAFTEFKRSHLFVISAEDNLDTAALDLTPGDHDVPPFSLGGQDMYAVSPDGKELAYTSNIDEVEATSTNNEIFIVPLAGGEPKKISTSPGSDATPLYSPDGKYLAWRSQARAGYESDKESLIIYDRQADQLRDATGGFRTVGGRHRVVTRRQGGFLYGGRSWRSTDLCIIVLAGAVGSHPNGGHKNACRRYRVRTRWEAPVFFALDGGIAKRDRVRRCFGLVRRWIRGCAQARDGDAHERCLVLATRFAAVGIVHLYRGGEYGGPGLPA